MNPIKSASPVASWFLRLAMAVYAYVNYFDTFMTFSFNGLGYFIAAGYVLFTFMLLAGGFVKKSQTTVLAGLFIAALSVFLMVYNGFSADKLLMHFIPFSLGFNFLAKGNQK